MNRALCFVLMPVGRRTRPDGRMIDFDHVYDELFAPAIHAAGFEPFKGDDEQFSGPLCNPALQRLMLCQYALVDLTLGNEDVFYQLGARHAARPSTTLCAFAEGSAQHVSEAALLEAVPYRITQDGAPLESAAACACLTERLQNMRRHSPEIPLLTLLEDYPHVAHEKTDVFLQSVPLPEGDRQELARLAALPREEAERGLRDYEARLGPFAGADSAVIVALYLAYRDLQSHADMIRVAHEMPKPLANTLLVREQYAFALNRLGRSQEAEALLERLLATHGPSSETYALLGRVYKDRYDAAHQAGDTKLAASCLRRAAEAYLAGFEADPRDDYPGVNALTLLAIRDPRDPRIAELLPAVRYSARRRVAAGRAGYWSHAALMELAVLDRDEPEANAQLAQALSHKPEAWKLQSTARNLRLLQETCVAPQWLEKIIRGLEKPADRGR